MGLADQFSADANATPAGSSLASQFLSDVAQPAPAKVEAAAPSLLSQVGRQVGLTARAGLTGVTALPSIVGDALNAGVNKVFGTNLPPVSSIVQHAGDAVGLPNPENAEERIVQNVASGMAGTGPSMLMGKALAGGAAPLTQAIGQALQTAPGMQVLGSAGSGAGSGAARELGLGPGWQIAAGIGGGAAGVLGSSALTPIAKSIGNRISPPPPLSPAAAASRAEAGVQQAVSELGPQAKQAYLTPGQEEQLAPLQQTIQDAIQKDPNVSAAAVMRNQDFKELGMQPTLGQITRDPTQYALELNMRGMPNVGAPLTSRLNQQNTQLQKALYGLAGSPSDAYSAGTAIKGSLASIDNGLSKQVSNAYAAAKASSGKDLDIPLTGLAQDYASVIKNFGDKVPSGVRNNFEELGLISGRQRQVFTVDHAENLLKVINSNRSNDPATNEALDVLNRSVKNAVLSADDQGGAYAGARQLAAQRFALHDEVPALEAASHDSVNADDFVRKFIVGGKTDQVVGLANLLKSSDPAAFNEAKNQLGAQLALKAFGQNVAADAPFKPSGYVSQLQAFGPNKLGAFYTPEELSQLNTIGRVGSYMNAFPSAAPVNTSNTGSALTALLGAGVKRIPVVGGLIENAHNRMLVSKALSANLSDAQIPQLPPNQMALGRALITPPPNSGR